MARPLCLFTSSQLLLHWVVFPVELCFTYTLAFVFVLSLSSPLSHSLLHFDMLKEKKTRLLPLFCLSSIYFIPLVFLLILLLLHSSFSSHEAHGTMEYLIQGTHLEPPHRPRVCFFLVPTEKKKKGDGDGGGKEGNPVPNWSGQTKDKLRGRRRRKWKRGRWYGCKEWTTKKRGLGRGKVRKEKKKGYIQSGHTHTQAEGVAR